MRRHILVMLILALAGTAFAETVKRADGADITINTGDYIYPFDVIYSIENDIPGGGRVHLEHRYWGTEPKYMVVEIQDVIEKEEKPYLDEPPNRYKVPLRGTITKKGRLDIEGVGYLDLRIDREKRLKVTLNQ